MKLCDSGHTEVCYEDRDCPACALVEEIKNFKKQIKDLEKQLEECEEER